MKKIKIEFDLMNKNNTEITTEDFLNIINDIKISLESKYKIDEFKPILRKVK